MNNEKSEEKPSFIAEIQLGKVVKYLRFAGYDTVTLSGVSRQTLLRLARKQGRLLLTTGRAEDAGNPLLLRLPDTKLKTSLEFVNDALRLSSHYAPFSRCIRCNATLESLEEPPDSLPSFVRDRFSEFRHCPECGRVYWKGSHYRRMDETWREIFQRSS